MNNAWLFTINVKDYAIFTALKNLKKHTISQGVKNIDKFNIGDVVYLYLGSPLYLVKYKCKIVDKYSKNERPPINDDAYVFNDKLKVANSDEFINLKCVLEIKSNELTKSIIEKNGFKFNQTTIRQLDDNVIKYFESVINR